MLGYFNTVQVHNTYGKSIIPVCLLYTSVDAPKNKASVAVCLNRDFIIFFKFLKQGPLGNI